MTTPDLITFLLRQAEIASSTDRGQVLAEAAYRLAGLEAEVERLRKALGLAERSLIGVQMEERAVAWSGVVRALEGP